MTKPSSSIKTQLILRIFSPIILLFFVVGGVAFFSADDEIAEVTDAQLAYSAKMLLQLAAYDVDKYSLEKIETAIEPMGVVHSYEKNLIFRIWKNNQLIDQSPRAENFKNLPGSSGFSDLTISGENWRLLVLADQKRNIKIEIAEKSVVRDELIFNIMLGLLLPLSIFIPLLLFIVWLAIHKGLNRLVVVSRSMDQREPNDFTKMDIDGTPQEILPLINAFNGLLQRMQSSFERERYFTDNAAHELRTPLAAIKTQTQVLLLKTEEMPDCRDGLDNLHTTIERASHMVDQLLSFSRLQSVKTNFDIVNLDEITEETLRHIAPLAIEKGVDLGADIAPGIKVKGDANALMVLIRNLVHNAIKFTPESGRVDVSITVEKQQAILKIVDTGRGIDKDKKELVFERFYRVSRNDGMGSGLGLSMVKWVCEMHEAEIVLEDNRPNGLIVTITIDTLSDCGINLC